MTKPKRNSQKANNMAKQKDGKTKKGTLVFMIFTIVFLLIIMMIGVIIHQAQTNTKKQTDGQLSGQQQSGQVQSNSKINTKGQPMMGTKTAPVTLVEFGDYRCIYCKQFEETIVPQLKKDYIDNGKAKFYFINFTILGEGSRIAANASEAIYHMAPNHFWDFHAALYKNQGDEKKSWVTNGLLEKIAKNSVPSLDMAAFKQALTKDTYEQQVLNDHAMAVNLGLQGTPDLFVNGQAISDPLNYKMVQKAINAALNGANK